MATIKRWAFGVICLGVWAASYGVFLRLEKYIEPAMFASGHPGRWWIIVLGYWVTDTVVWVCTAYALQRPFGLKVPEGYPFFQFASDLAIVVLLVHISWLCTDSSLSRPLDSVGLTNLPWVFLFLAVLWGATALLKFLELTRIVRRLPQEHGSEHRVNESV
jgi:hypothetical protein